MRDQFAPVIEGFDCDGITSPWSFRCEPFYEDGGSGGTMLDGTTIHDVLAAKGRFSWTLNVLTPEQYAALNTVLNAGEAIGTVAAYVYDTTCNAVRLAQFHVTPPACHTIYNFGRLYVIPQSALILEEAAPVARFVITPPTDPDLTGLSVTQYDPDGNPTDITEQCTPIIDDTAVPNPGDTPIPIELTDSGIEIGRITIPVVPTPAPTPAPTLQMYVENDTLFISGAGASVSGNSLSLASNDVSMVNGTLYYNRNGVT